MIKSYIVLWREKHRIWPWSIYVRNIIVFMKKLEIIFSNLCLWYSSFISTKYLWVVHGFHIVIVSRSSSKIKNILLEAATRGVLWKKVFLKVSQNSQENTCARVFFLIKLQATGLFSGVFLWILRNLKERLFYRTPLGDCFCVTGFQKKFVIIFQN